MGTLADCMKKLGIAGPEAKYIADTIKLYRKEGFAAPEARIKAVRDIVRDTRRQQRSVVEQISKELERRNPPAPPAPEQKPVIEGSAKDFVASLAKPKKGERPRTLTADDFVRQVRVAATSPEEAESIIALASANAEYRNQSLDAWVGENIAGVEKTDAKKSAYLKQFPDGPPDALALVDSDKQTDPNNPSILAQKERKVRGEVQFLKNDGRAIIRAFKGSQNVATLAHELGHVFRRTLLPEDMRIAERALGVKEGNKWTRPQEERFARHFERYLRDGVAPTKKLATVFEKFKNWLTTIYRNLAGGPLKDEIPPELRDVFDRMLGATDAQIAERNGGDASFDFGAQPGAGEAAAAPAAAPFELSREGSPDASPIVEAYQPERIAEAGPRERQPLLPGTPADMASGTLEGQQGLFQAAGGTPTVEFPSSVKNASTAADREAMGLPPRPEVEPHTWPSADQEALATLYRDPQAGQKIVAELLQQEKPRPLNDNETFILSNHIVRLKNEINAIARQSADAEDAGDAQAVADLKERYDDLSQQLFDADRAAESTGTEQSRGLNARKALKNADYSLASMELRERQALGRPLTEDERKQLMERDRKRRRKLAEIEDTETEAKQKAFEEASDKQRKRSRVKKEDWTPGDIDLTPESEQLDINRTVEQLARYYFRQGITDREENIMAVHEFLQPYLGEGWTLDNARDALSGYGEIRPLSDKAEDQWYRQTRREQQKVRKLIDMLAGRPPKITGTEREEPNQENRDLTKTVNNYKRFYNITSGDDASNARSALDAVKTRLNNEIRDLEKQIREKNKIIKRKNDIQYDTEANALKAKRDALKAQFDEIFGKPEMTDAKRMELAMKAMERNMAELDRRIKERDFTVSTPRVFDSPEYRALKTKQDAMRAEYENLREYDPQYMEQQRQKRLAAVEARIADYEQQIATGNFATPAARKAVDLDLQAAQEVRDALRKRRNEVRKTDPEWMRQQQLKEARRLEVRLLKRAERLADRMGRQDYASKPAERQHGPLDEKLSRLYDELNKMQREFDDHVYDVNLRGTLQARIADKKRQMDTKVFVDRPQREARPISPETKMLAAQAKIIDKAYERERQQYERTVIGHLWDATNLMRLFQTTGEYSPVLLQGGKEAAASLGGLAVGDVTTGKNFGTAVLRGFKAFASPEYAKAHDKALFENPRLPLWMDAGLRLILEGEHITPSEELEYSKKLLNHIPIARKIIPRFEDMARVFYNDMRTSAFDAMTIMMPDATPEQLHALARFANVSTGYSTLGSQGEAAAKAASVFLFSPRNLAANFRYAIFEPVMRGDAKGVRTIILKKYAKTLIGVAVAFGLAKLGGADISLDPSSPDFLKWKFGNTRLNPLAGLQQLFVMGYRSATGKTTSSDGNARNTDAYSVHAQFLRGKLAPQLALGYDLLAGKNVVGEPVNFDLTGDHFPYVLPNLLDRITPMTYSDVVKAIQEQGVPRGSAIGIAALFGMPTQTYQPKQHPGSPRNRAPRERRPKR